MSSESCLVKAIYLFKGKNNDELCFKKGDIITVTQKEEGGWWEGTLGETTGWFPSNYVTEYKDPSGSATTSPIRAASEIQAFRNVVLKDIIDSEKAHVAEMQGLVSNFLQPLEKSDMLTRDEFRQLTGNINEVLQTHEQFLSLLEECATKTGPDQRVGGLFLQWAPKIKSVHQTYCAGHPKAVCILDKYKEELNTWMESAGAVTPGVLVLTAGLSKPFRRLGKYPAMLQELARHVHEAHPDRGDTHRASAVYKDVAGGCAALRRQKELELQVVTGAVRGWAGGELAALGDVLHMGGVAVGAAHQDRYLVLFPSALLLLSVSKRVSAFVYEGCLPLTGITVCKLDDTESRKNAFEISGPMIDTILAVCQTRAEADNWVGLLQKHSLAGSPAQPRSLPHLTRSPSEGALSSISAGRRSLYRVTLPPPGYPPASPYYSLTKYFARLVKKKVITKQMLRKLLHERTWAKAFELTGLPVMRRHRNLVRLRVEPDGTVGAEPDTDSEGEQSDTGRAEPWAGARVTRQDALDGPRELSSACSSWGDYTRGSDDYTRGSDDYTRGSDDYTRGSDDYTQGSGDSADSHERLAVRGDCTREIFLNAPYVHHHVKTIDTNVQLQPPPHGGIDNQFFLHSESTDNSSFEVRPYMACEDLVNMDEDTRLDSLGDDADFVPSRRSFPDCSARSDPRPKLWKSSEEQHARGGALPALEPRSPLHSLIIDPPPMFRNREDDMNIINVNLNTNMPFRKHSLNSDKRLSRRSAARSVAEAEPGRLQRMSDTCECCNRSLCASPRSSDSGMVGSCTLASPELAPDAGGPARERGAAARVARDKFADDLRKQLTLSEIDAARFEEQCRCTSPFGSTARTSSVASAGARDSTPAPRDSTPAPRVERTSLRRFVERYAEEAGPEPPPRARRPPSAHAEAPRNVRRPPPAQWSTLDVAPRTKPSLHYHLRVYREPERSAGRPGGAGGARSEPRRPRSRSEDSSKARQGLEEARGGFVVYRSDLYAHWWMKAKLPITVLTDSGKDYSFMASSDSNNSDLSSGLTDHKRSHSFNNHQSYTQHSQQTQKSNKQKNQSAGWLPEPCAAEQAPVAPHKHAVGKKYSSVDFIDSAGSSYPTKGWSIASLRPAPALRPAWLPGAGAGAGEEPPGAAPPYAPHQRKSNSYEEDALVLKVIEAYCTSARGRHALSSECEEEGPGAEALARSPSLPLPARAGLGAAGAAGAPAASLWTLVMRLQTDIKTLKLDVKHLQIQLREEKHERALAAATLRTKHVLIDAKESNC